MDIISFCFQPVSGSRRWVSVSDAYSAKSDRRREREKRRDVKCVYVTKITTE